MAGRELSSRKNMIYTVIRKSNMGILSISLKGRTQSILIS